VKVQLKMILDHLERDFVCDRREQEGEGWKMGGKKDGLGFGF